MERMTSSRVHAYALSIAFIASAGCATEEGLDPESVDDQAESAEFSMDFALKEQSATTAEAGAKDEVGIALYYPVCRVHGPVPLPWRHPAGVDTWLISGGTVFEKGDFCQLGKSLLVMQNDGNFVLYDERGFRPEYARWASHTYGRGVRAAFQTDGNLVVYDNFGAIRTSTVPTDTCCNTGYNLHLQADGNLVIYAPGWNPIWTTGTSH